MISFTTYGNGGGDLLFQDDDDSGRVLAFSMAPPETPGDTPVLTKVFDKTIPESWEEDTHMFVGSVGDDITDSDKDPVELLNLAWEQLKAEHEDEDEDEEDEDEE